MKAIWESLDKPYRAALEQGLIYTRLGNPLGQAELAAGRCSGHRAEAALMDHPLVARIAGVLELQPDAPAIEFDGQWFSWRELGAAARRIQALTRPGAQVGILLRNRPAHVAAFLGVLLGGGCVVVINPSHGEDRIRADLEALRLPVRRRRAPTTSRSSQPQARRWCRSRG